MVQTRSAALRHSQMDPTVGERMDRMEHTLQVIQSLPQNQASTSTPEPASTPAQTVGERMDRIVRMLERVIQSLLQNQANTSTPAEPSSTPAQPVVQPAQQELPPVQPGHQGNDKDPAHLYKQFQVMKPSSFDGTGDCVAAEEWLLEMERIFEIMTYTEVHKVALATFTFRGAAHDWWLLEKAREPQMTWQRFTQVFNEKYFPQEERDRLAAEFLVLQQGNMTVEQYEARFTELAWYARTVIMTEAMKARKFEAGLRWAIKNRIEPMQLTTYSKVVSTAKIIEQSGEEFARRRANTSRNQGRQSGPTFTRPGAGSRSTGTSQRRAASTSRGVARCLTCQKSHKGPCYRDSNICYSCGQTGHFKAYCPQKNRSIATPPTSDESYASTRSCDWEFL